MKSAPPILIPCPVCEAPDGYELVGYGAYGRPVVRCPRDGVWIAQGSPRIGDIAAAPQWEPGDPRRYAAILAAVRPHAKPGARLHDMGCGTGGMLAAARADGYAVTGSDISELAVESVRQMGIEAWAGRLIDIPVAGANVLTSACVFPHHIADWQTEVAGIRHVLQRGG
jgi:SAM-dependent methyltransferase